MIKEVIVSVNDEDMGIKPQASRNSLTAITASPVNIPGISPDLVWAYT